MGILVGNDRVVLAGCGRSSSHQLQSNQFIRIHSTHFTDAYTTTHQQQRYITVFQNGPNYKQHIRAKYLLLAPPLHIVSLQKHIRYAALQQQMYGIDIMLQIIIYKVNFRTIISAIHCHSRIHWWLCGLYTVKTCK